MQIMPLFLTGVPGARKTIVYVALVVVLSTIAGLVFGAVWG